MTSARRRYGSLTLFLAAILLPTAAPLQAEQVGAAADASACLSCHGQAGSELAPLLEGQHAGYLKVQMARFRDHIRQSFPMDALTQGLDDAAIEQISAQLAARPWPERVPARRSEGADGDPASAANLSACVGCHGEQLLGADKVPRLAGQRRNYVLQQLEAIASQRRQHPDLGSSAALSRREMSELAAAIEAR